MIDIVRLHLALLRGPDGRDWPVHGFALKHPSAGVILVDTGVGGPEDALQDWQVVNRTVADALDEHDLSPADVTMVINTHLHFDHCGQNAAFAHAPFHVQREELHRARTEEPELADWFDFAGARFELLDGDTEVAPGVRVLATPGHTSGHQSVVVDTGADASELLVGDAIYNSRVYANPDPETLPDGQAADVPTWQRSTAMLVGLGASRVHYCHDPIVTRGRPPRR